MNRHEAQRRALRNHCRLASETLLAPAFVLGPVSIVLSVNSGYE